MTNASVADAVDHAAQRRATVALGWAARLVTVGTSLATVRVALDILGPGQYAVYQLLTGALAWVTLGSLGLGPALKNLVSEHRARGESDAVVRGVSAFLVAALLAVGLPAMLAGASGAAGFLFRRVEHNPLWASRAMLVGGALTLCSVMGQVSFEVLYAELRARWVYGLTIAGAVVGVALLTLVPRLGRAPDEALFWVVCASLGPPAVSGVVALRATGLMPRRRRPWDPRVARRVVALAGRFWVFATLSNLVLMVDTLVIGQVLPADGIVLYTVLMRVVTVGLAFSTTVISVAWPEWTRLWAVSDLATLRRRVYRLAVAGVVACVPAALVGARVVPFVLRAWLPAAHLAPNAALTLAFVAYFAVRFWTDVHSGALMSGNRVGAATRYALAQALITAPLEFVLGRRYGPGGVVTGLLIGFAGTAAWMFPRRFYAETRVAGAA